MLTQLSLSGGPTLLVDHRQEAGSFFCSLWFPFGSRHEASCERGFSHYIEHMLFKGNIRYSAQEIWAIAEGSGGFLNGFTERDTLCIHAHVPAAEWMTALDLLANMAFTSTFPACEFEKERNVILAEILQAGDEVEEQVLDEFFACFWQGQPASFPIAGISTEIKTLKREKVIELYRRFFAPHNAIIAVSGPVSASEISDVMERILAEIHSETDHMPHDNRVITGIVPKPCSGKFYKKTTSSQQFHLEAFQLDRPFEGFDYYTLSLVSNLIGESSSSRLFRKIREEEGLAYIISSSLYHSRTEAVLLMVSAFDAEQTARLLALIADELEKLFIDSLLDNELSDHRRRLAGSFQIMLEDPEFRARRIARNFIDSGLIMDEKEELNRYLSVDRKQVETVLMNLKRAPCTQFLFGPLEQEKAEELGFQKTQSWRKTRAKLDNYDPDTPR